MFKKKMVEETYEYTLNDVLNIACAIYMGAKYDHPYNNYLGACGDHFYFPTKLVGDKVVETAPGIYRNYSLSALKYHLSWDWLMPVYAKYSREMNDYDVDKSFLPYFDNIQMLFNVLADQIALIPDIYDLVKDIYIKAKSK